MASPTITIKKWSVATEEDRQSGLLAYVQIAYGDVLIDVTARRTATGRIVLSYPERRDSSGRRHSVVRPIDDKARRAIEAAVFTEATLVREVPR